MSAELSTILYKCPRRVQAGLMPLFPVWTLQSPADPIYFKNEIRVILRTMTGKEHFVGIANTEFSSALFLWAAHLFNVNHTQIALFGDTTILTGDEPLTTLAPLLEKTGNVLHVIVNDPPAIVPSSSQPDVLLLPRAYRGHVGEGW